MSVQHQGVRADWLEEPVKALLVNSTGTAVTAGDCAAMNFDFGNSTVDEFSPSTESTYLLNHAIAITKHASNGGNGDRMIVVAAEDIASTAKGQWWIKGFYIDVLVTGDTNKGEYLVATDAAEGLTPLTHAEFDATTTDVGIVGIALETRTGAGLVKAWFDGRAWKQQGGNVS